MSPKKAPTPQKTTSKPTSKAPTHLTGAPAKSASKGRAKGRAQPLAKAAAARPVHPPSKGAPPSQVQRAAVRRAHKRASPLNELSDELLDRPLIEPSSRRLRAPSGVPSQPPADETSDGSALSPQLRRGFAMVLLLMVGAALLVALFQSRGAWLAALTTAAGWAGPATGTPAATALANTLASAPDVAATDAAAPANRVGIISGHRGNDSGAVCPDGLTEAQVNFDAATRVASILRAQGYTVDVLDEFDSRLKGYRARALLSIHADSCAEINPQATGYKVARFLYSAIPEDEDELVACVSARYKAATGLKFHRNTVTHNMLQYHAFREIAVNTPSAIIELGFMNLDRQLLTRQKDTVAQGVSEGLLCYLNGETP